MKFKKVLSGTLAAMMLAGTVMSSSATAESAEESEFSKIPFSDVISDSWYEDYVKFVYDNEIMLGTFPTLFEPDTQLTRAMFVTILGRYCGEAENEEGGERFTDIEKNSWYSGYVGWATEIGVVEGKSVDEFDPTAPIKRAEIAAMLGRYIKYAEYTIKDKSGVPEKFADKALIDSTYSYAAEHIEMLRKSGVMDGKPGVGDAPVFEPESPATRAEAAKLIMMADKLKNNTPWEGYVPSPEEDGYAVYGASYLYHEGPIVQGSLGTSLARKNGSPVLRAYRDRLTEKKSRFNPDTIGVSAQVARLDLRKLPFVKVCYSLEGEDTAVLKGEFSLNTITSRERHAEIEFPLNVSETDEYGFATGTACLTETIAQAGEVNYTNDFLHVFFKLDDKAERLDIRYIAFFESEEAADAFDASGLNDYMLNYRVPSDIDYSVDNGILAAEYNKKITNRIQEILSSESEITPESIKSEGGRSYYVSSIDPNASDDNDGKSPETPWKSTAKVMEELDVFGKIQYGDAVFFERGSEFYPERYQNNSKAVLKGEYGVAFAAYGEGAKPLFTGALDFREKNNGTGNWISTEYPDIYVLDEIDKNPDFCGEKADIGNIVFNFGEMTGVRVVPRDSSDPMGENKTTYDIGLCCNGSEYYYVGSRPCNNISTVLQNDLEFFHDFKEGKLYLYCKGGNPSDRFNDIKVSAKNYTVTIEEDARVDNLAMCYSSWSLLDSGDADNVTITNCEIGFVCGGMASIDSAAGSMGGVDGYTIKNCYIHDVGDGGITNQSTNWDGLEIIRNSLYENNVLVCCGAGIETWNSLGPIDENGYAQNYLENVRAVGNIIAYSGYGISKKQASAGNCKGAFICSSMYMEGRNCVIENNEFLFIDGDVVEAPFSSNAHERGWILRDNIYLVNPSLGGFMYMYETIHMFVNHNMYKDNRVSMPFTERYLRFYTSHGVDPTGKYISLDKELTDEMKNGGAYTNGYLLSKGIYPET